MGEWMRGMACMVCAREILPGDYDVLCLACYQMWKHKTLEELLWGGGNNDHGLLHSDVVTTTRYVLRHIGTLKEV